MKHEDKLLLAFRDNKPVGKVEEESGSLVAARHGSSMTMIKPHFLCQRMERRNLG